MWISKKKYNEAIEEAKSDASFEAWNEYREQRAEEAQSKRISDLAARVEALEESNQVRELSAMISDRRQGKHACKCGNSHG